MITAGSALSPLITGARAVLTADVTLMALVSGVLNDVPLGQATPYVQIISATEIPFDFMGKQGRECSLTIKAVTGAEYEGDALGLQIINRVILLLNRATLTVTGYTSISIWFETLLPFPEEDKGVLFRHFPAQFRALVQGT